MSRDCPHCGLTNPVTAARCDCGFDFVAKRITGPPTLRLGGGRGWQIALAVTPLAMIAGAALGLWIGGGSGDPHGYVRLYRAAVGAMVVLVLMATGGLVALLVHSWTR